MFVKLRKRDDRKDAFNKPKMLKVSCISLSDGCDLVVDSKKIQELLCNIMGIEEPQPKSALEILINKSKNDAWCPVFKPRSLSINSPLQNYRNILRDRHRIDICRPKSKHKILWTIGVYRGPDYKDGRCETSIGSKEVI